MNNLFLINQTYLNKIIEDDNIELFNEIISKIPIEMLPTFKNYIPINREKNKLIEIQPIQLVKSTTMVKLLLDNSNNINAIDKHGNNILHLIKDENIMEFVLSEYPKLNINQQNLMNNTPMHVASEKNKKILLKYEANPTIINVSGIYPNGKYNMDSDTDNEINTDNELDTYNEFESEFENEEEINNKLINL